MPVRIVAADDPVVLAATAAVQAGDVAALDSVLAEHPWLATARVGDASSHRTLLHVVTDWPGHFPNGPDVVRRVVAAGGDPSAPGHFAAHTETPLHWAASSDDVAVLDALLDAGADIAAPGAVLGGGTALADACGFGNWAAARRLVERGSPVTLTEAAALGLLDRLRAGLATGPPAVEITHALWSACAGGQLPAVELLVAAGADVDWVGWDGLTPAQAAARADADDVVAWLAARAAS